MLYRRVSNASQRGGPRPTTKQPFCSKIDFPIPTFVVHGCVGGGVLNGLPEPGDALSHYVPWAWGLGKAFRIDALGLEARFRIAFPRAWWALGSLFELTPLSWGRAFYLVSLEVQLDSFKIHLTALRIHLAAFTIHLGSFRVHLHASRAYLDVFRIHLGAFRGTCILSI